MYENIELDISEETTYEEFKEKTKRYPLYITFLK